MKSLQIKHPASSAFLFDGQGGARELTSAELGNWTPADGHLWLHLNYKQEEEQQWLTDSSSLNPIVINALLATDTRPRATIIDHGLLVSLRGVNLHPGADPDDMVSIRLWIDESRTISTRNRDLYSVGDVIEELKLGHGPCNPAEFIVDLINKLIWRIGETVTQFEERVDDIEDQILLEYHSSLRNDLAILRRQVIAMHRYLAPQREALAVLIYDNKVSWWTENTRHRLREVSDSLIRHIEDLDLVRDRAAVTQEELQSRVTEQMNARMYVMSVIAAIFLPLGFLTGLLGINIGGIPGADYPYAFYIFTLMLITVVAFQVLLFRFKKWM